MSTNPSRASFPLRGLLYSVVIHSLAFTASLFVPWNYWLPSEMQVKPWERIIREQEVLLLPDLSTEEKGSAAAPDSGASLLARTAVPAGSLPIFRGAQVIISNPLKPDNYAQTVRQPDILKPPKLPFPMAMPNLILMAAPRPVLAPSPPVQEKPIPTSPTIPRNTATPRLPQMAVAVATPPPVEPPRLPLPPARAVPVPTASPSLQATESKAAEPEPPPPPAVGAADARNLAVLSAVVAPKKDDLEVPPGELHGAFAVLPDPTASLGEPTTTATTVTVTPGNPEPATTKPVGANPAHAGGTANGNGAIATGKKAPGAAPGAGNGTNAGKIKGTGAAGGSGGPGAGTTSGGGAGGPFADLVISGGTSKTGRVGGTHVPPSTSKPNPGYGITIVGSGASGGGFKDYGIFRNEAVYTIYLDMRDAGDVGPNWAMQYALLRKPDAGLIITGASSQGVLTPPYPTNKEIPQIPPEFADKHGGGTVIVYAVITPEGRVEDIRVLSTPEAALNKSVMDTIRRWSFRPAELDGQGVPVKVLLGVPIDALAPAHPAS